MFFYNPPRAWGLKDESQFFVIGKWKQWIQPERNKKCKNVPKSATICDKLWLLISLATSNIFEICQKVELRVFVAGVVEKGSESIWPMGAELRLLKVGVSHFVALDSMQS